MIRLRQKKKIAIAGVISLEHSTMVVCDGLPAASLERFILCLAPLLQMLKQSFETKLLCHKEDHDKD